MSKLVRILAVCALCCVAFTTLKAEPAALGRVGVGGQEASTGKIACDSCSTQSGATSAAGATSLTLTPVRNGAGGVTPFAINSGAGYAVLNGGDFESPTTPKPVPEPATIALMGAGLAALAFGLKRRG